VEAVWPACGSQGVRCRALVGPSDVGEGAALDAVGRRSSLPVVCGQKERDVGRTARLGPEPRAPPPHLSLLCFPLSLSAIYASLFSAGNRGRERDEAAALDPTPSLSLSLPPSHVSFFLYSVSLVMLGSDGWAGRGVGQTAVSRSYALVPELGSGLEL
jgi:hypothetical protein